MDLEVDDTTPVVLPGAPGETPAEGQSEDDLNVQKKYKMMLSMWLSFCIIGFVWFVTKVLKGRQRIRTNFSSIEEQLRRMQAVIEERERAMAENGGGDEEQQNQLAEKNNCNGDGPKVSPDAQKLLETLTKAFGKTESEENLESLEESDETTEIASGNAADCQIEDVQDTREEINGNNGNNGDLSDEEGAPGQSRRRKFVDPHPLDALRDTIEDIIQEGVKEVEEPSKKDD